MSKSKRRRNSKAPTKSRRSIPQRRGIHRVGITLALCFGLLLITFLVFGRSIGYGFFNYDDSYYVYQNPLISNGLTKEGLAKAFTRPLVGNWHPLTSISLMLDAQWSGLNAHGYHLIN